MLNIATFVQKMESYKHPVNLSRRHWLTELGKAVLQSPVEIYSPLQTLRIPIEKMRILRCAEELLLTRDEDPYAAAYLVNENAYVHKFYSRRRELLQNTADLLFMENKEVKWLTNLNGQSKDGEDAEETGWMAIEIEFAPEPGKNQKGKEKFNECRPRESENENEMGNLVWFV